MTITATIGGASSDSYITMAEYGAYAADMGWQDTFVDEPMVRRAAQMLDRNYTWSGYRATSTQALVWPRTTSVYVDGWAVPSDTVPAAIKAAQCELAYLIATGETPFATLSGGAIKRVLKRVEGAVTTDIEYAEGTSRDRASYPAVDALVGPYITGKAGARAGSISLMRA